MVFQRAVFAGAILILTLAASRGRAGSIPWSYEWDTHPIVCNADSPNSNGSPVGGIHLTPGAITITGNPHGIAWGNGSIVAVKLTTFSFSPSPDGPARFTDAPYQLAVKLTDVNSNKSGNLQFSGVFNGTMTDTAVNVQTRFTSPTWRSIVLGENMYTVTLTSYSPPGPPTAGSAGSISAFVAVHPESAPEPSSLLLAGSGLATTLLTWLRRRLAGFRFSV